MNSRPRIIAIHGQMGAGKDTAGAIIARWLRMNCVRSYHQSFALTVKQNVSNLIGVDLQQVKTHCPIPGKVYENEQWDFTREQRTIHLDDWGMTIGRMLQIYATEGVRDGLHQDAWILALKPKLISGDDCMNIITDLRFPNEVEWLKQVGAITIKIKRDQLLENETRDVKHSSESGLPDDLFTIVVDNNGTFEEFTDKIVKIAEDIALDLIMS